MTKVEKNRGYVPIPNKSLNCHTMFPINFMTDKERIEKLELRCAEFIRWQDEHVNNLTRTNERLIQLEARLEKMMALLGTTAEKLDEGTHLWEHAYFLRWQLAQRQN
jgi:hypothetical protein